MLVARQSHLRPGKETEVQTAEASLLGRRIRLDEVDAAVAERAKSK
jgi:hypothetical protein